MLKGPALCPRNIDDSVDNRMADMHSLRTKLPGERLCQRSESKLACRKRRTIGGSSQAGSGTLCDMSAMCSKSTVPRYQKLCRTGEDQSGRVLQVRGLQEQRQGDLGEVERSLAVCVMSVIWSRAIERKDVNGSDRTLG